MPGSKSPFDRGYYDKWYRSDTHRVRYPADVKRHAELAVAAAEYVLQRPIRRVLDVGCGEGDWYTALRAIRPRVAYAGIDPSEYVVERFGARRNITRATFGDLETVDALERYDLVVCVDALPYVEPAELARGANALGDRLTGVALLHAYTTEDDIVGDVTRLVKRPAAWYRRIFARAGLDAVGLGLWISHRERDLVSALESA